MNFLTKPNTQHELVISIQREIINAQRLRLESLSKELSTSDDHRWRYFLEQAINRLDQEMRKLHIRTEIADENSA